MMNFLFLPLLVEEVVLFLLFLLYLFNELWSIVYILLWLLCFTWRLINKSVHHNIFVLELVGLLLLLELNLHFYLFILFWVSFYYLLFFHLLLELSLNELILVFILQLSFIHWFHLNLDIVLFVFFYFTGWYWFFDWFFGYDVMLANNVFRNGFLWFILFSFIFLHSHNLLHDFNLLLGWWDTRQCDCILLSNQFLCFGFFLFLLLSNHLYIFFIRVVLVDLGQFKPLFLIGFGFFVDLLFFL